ncbi:class I SAM-dependent methyltransferase [Chitinophaga pendula]|uniref:O-methyltransferase n=1 Tax=Chitinophaga TaxID=79328 RepID=UPI000BB0BF37|nr:MULTISPECIES: class I SAM-dependent methyltransferase [Chitinophaga]ASZ14299.1 SAM-dependent methyltransferase [Chitinophaga sp. MD30]UCJ08053.1 class I SAM-dependent methyltransferase [Chitinophaga pendula]
MSLQHQYQLAKKYLHYYFTAGNRHDVHSPFVYSLVEEVLRNRKSRPEYVSIEQLRKQLLASDATLQVTDLGAGSLVSAGNERKISDITRHAAKPAKFGQLFYRLVEYFQPQYLLELGTSMGMSTAYMASARPESEVITIEGCPNIAAQAGRNFERLHLQNVRQVVGNFDTVLPEVLATVPQLDWVYIDGNHRSGPTVEYFRQCLPKATEYSVFIFDDIHWTPDMEAAWHTIQQEPAVTLTIDLFFIGLVFFRKEPKVKQHFVLKY